MAVPSAMLRVLRIRNLAVLQAVEVRFEPGLNVLTGETGTGKSILVEALGLLLGARASSDLVRTGEAQASVEAVFEGPDEEIVLRREVTSQGRSRAFVNGTLVTTAALREVAQQLVEIHGQHAHQALLDPATHLPFLDASAGLHDLVARVSGLWTTVRSARERLDRSRMDARERAARLDLVTFQLGEIEAVAPRPGEDAELRALERRLAAADRIQRLCGESYAALYDGDSAVLAQLAGVWKRLDELAAVDPRFTPFVEEREGIKAQLEELAHVLRRSSDEVDASPDRLQQVGDRLARLERLERKYGPTLQEVIDRGAALARERRLLSGEEGSAEDLQRELDAAQEAYLSAARDLSRRRRAAATAFSQRLEYLLSELAMEQARVEVRFNAADLAATEWSDRGIDRAEFFLSPNPGEEPRPLARIASGGELSRVMLALETPGLAADGPAHDPAAGPATLVFDEVDAGIGGRVADVVGSRLRELGARVQVLCITHLPQIAARAGTQFRIDKSVRDGRTMTAVTRLDEGDRVEEIARMMAGGAVGDAVRHSARDLLDHAARGPSGREAPRRGESEGSSERRKRKWPGNTASKPSAAR